MSREYEVTERYDAGRRRLPAMLSELADSNACRSTVYLPPGGAHAGLPGEAAAAARLVGDSETGLALFLCDDRVIVVAPPFPLEEGLCSEGAVTGPLARLLDRDLVVGVILLRLGRYAVGALRGERLLASRSDTRYVKSRHRAGGSSQRRFERSRERLIRELFDKACQVAGETLAPFERRMDYLLLGGERHTLRRFVERCAFARRMAPVTLRRTLAVQRPGRAALLDIHQEVWKSRVYVLERRG